MRKSIILASAIILLTGCAKSPSIADLTASEERAFRNISVYMKGQQDTPSAYTTIAPVEGIDCKRNLYSGTDATASKAFESMKVVAAKHSASAIIDVECVDHGTSWSKNCWQTQICRGIAVQ